MARFAGIAVGVSMALVLTGCSVPRPLPTPTSSASETAGSTGDGVLRIGTLLPMSGDVASIGAGMVAAVDVAVRDINAAGGVLGQPVEVFYRDSGNADGTALESGFADLLARDVDVVIGPTSAALAERLAPLATDAGITVISPATLFSPPAEGLFGLAASAESHAEAIVSAIADEGGESVAILSTSTPLGRAFESAARAELESRGMRLAAVEQLDAATNPARLAFSVAGGEPDAVILASDSSLSALHPAIMTALTDRGITGGQLWMTAPALADYSTTVGAGLLEGAHGVREGAATSDEFLVRLRQSDPAVVSARFAAETYDAVILGALAAEIAGDESGRSIATFIRIAAADGIVCASFGECIAVLATEPQSDYEGLSGSVTMSADGAVTDATLSLYRYGADNRAELVGPIVSISP
jgi:branched-chain amino acid transport system substrate-binding protein